MPVSHSHQFLCVLPEAADHDGHALRLRRIGDVPDLVAGVAEGAQQVDLALVGARQLAAVAHAHHLRAAGFGRPRLARNVREIAAAASGR